VNAVQHTLTSLHLSECGLTDAHAKSLASAISGCSRLATLDVSSNTVGDDGLRVLARALSPLRVTSVDVSANQLSQDGVSAVESALPASLTALFSGRQWLGDEGGAQLASGHLLRTAPLRALDISHALTGWAAQHIVTALAANAPSFYLAELSLKGSRIGDQDLMAIASCLPALRALQALVLAENFFGWEGTEVLAEHVPHCTRLTHLNLDDNDVQYHGVDALADALLECPGMQRLSIARTNCNDEGLVALCESLRKWCSFPPPKAASRNSLEVDMTRNPITCVGVLLALDVLFNQSDTTESASVVPIAPVILDLQRPMTDCAGQASEGTGVVRPWSSAHARLRALHSSVDSTHRGSSPPQQGETRTDRARQAPADNEPRPTTETPALSSPTATNASASMPCGCATIDVRLPSHAVRTVADSGNENFSAEHATSARSPAMRAKLLRQGADPLAPPSRAAESDVAADCTLALSSREHSQHKHEQQLEPTTVVEFGY